MQAITNDGTKILSSETWSIRVDNSAPDPFALIAPADHSWTNQTIPLIWQPANDTGSQLSHYQLYINDQLRVDQIPADQNRVNLPPIRDDGAYTWSTRAVDHAGNSREAPPRVLNVDQTGPELFAALAPENHSWTGDSLQEFRWQATADAGIGLQHYRLVITNDPNQRQVTIDSTRYKPVEEPLSHGAVSWRVQACDSLGNCTETNLFFLNVDLKLPSAFSLMTPEDSSCVALPTPDFTWSTSADAGSGLSGYQLWIDGQLNRDQISGNSSAPSAALTEGPHTWFIRAVDNVGNYRQSPPRLVYCDWNAPVAPELVFPGDNHTVVSTLPVFRWSGGHDSGSGIASADIFIDGAKAGTVLQNDTLFIAQQRLNQGSHTWWVTVIDRAGNPKSSPIHSFNVDTTRNVTPVINPIADIAIDEGETLALQATATDQNDSDVLRFYDDSDLFDIGLLTGVIDFTPTTHHTGEYAITIIATDGHLSDSTRFTLTIGDVNHAPEPFSLLAPADRAEIDTLNPEFIWQAAHDPDAGDSLYYTIELGTDSSFSRIIYTETCTDTAFALFVTLSNHSTYYWRVCAFDRDKASCCCSSDFSFTTNKLSSHIIANDETGAIDTYRLLQNYPNPFNASTTIEFSLPKAGHVNLGIYNLQGQCINVLADQQMPAGWYRYSWEGIGMDGWAVTSGIYLCHLRADAFERVLKMMYVR
ncbi:T9SS type A sorting domain-containing protein [candidate division KSB1 bacterium]|nr:T9SS type A sorting domain-containing protein [candidate division KSB1 bacterium]